MTRCRLKSYLTILGLCFCMVPFALHAQELDATVSINTQQLEASFRGRFETLQSDLQEFINGQQWTSAQFSTVEKIKCTFALTIAEMTSGDSYRASLRVQSRRPVFNSNYNTSTLNWQDDNLTFDYTEGQTLVYNEFNLDNELIATVAYYVYLILGLDFDSFSPKGGEPYLRRADNIVSQMQSSDSKGWKAFADNKNRHAVISALLSDSQSAFRDAWYTYHRSGLDQMAQSVDKGRAQVSEACSMLSAVRKADAMTPLLSMFIGSKLDEVINIYSKAPKNEKEDIYKVLSEDFPTYSNRLSEIKNTSK